MRALFLDRELAEDFVAMDVTMLRLRSLAVEVPLGDFREEAGHPMELSEEGAPQWRCCFDDQCEARFESFKALARHVLRHHRQMEMVFRSVITNQCPVCLAVHGHLLSSLRRGSCRDRSRYLGQVHIPLSLRCPVCSAEPGNWSELQQHLAEHLCDVFKMTHFEMPSWGKRKSEEAPQGQGRRAVRQAVAEGGNDRDVTRRLVDVLATLSLVNAAELRELTATVFKTYLRAWPKQWQRQVVSTTNPLAQSRASPKQSAQTLKNSLVPRTCMCGWRSSAVWQRRGRQNT